MTSSQVLLGVGLILALAAGSRILASRLKIPAMPMTSAVVFPSSGCTWERSSVPMTGKFPSVESISCSRIAGFPDRTKPRMVASSGSGGKSANRPS